MTFQKSFFLQSNVYHSAFLCIGNNFKKEMDIEMKFHITLTNKSIFTIFVPLFNDLDVGYYFFPFYKD